MKSPLDQLEEKFKSLFEGKSFLLDGKDEPVNFLIRIRDEIIECLYPISIQQNDVPESFAIYLNPADSKLVEAYPEVEMIVNEMIKEIASEQNFMSPRKIEIKFITKNSFAPGEIEIKPCLAEKHPDRTDAIKTHHNSFKNEEVINDNQAAVILENGEIIPLTGSVINLGRKSNNHIVFDDMRVSRNHSQIRLISNEFVIFDTGSSGGTYVNGKRINLHTLRPGDVISLAGLKLIFTRNELKSSASQKEITSKIKPTAKDH